MCAFAQTNCAFAIFYEKRIHLPASDRPDSPDARAAESFCRRKIGFSLKIKHNWTKEECRINREKIIEEGKKEKVP